MTTCNYKSLLPENSTKLERAIEEVAHKQYCEIDPRRIIQHLSSPEDCPVEFLPWLALAKGVDFYNDNWSEQVKRNVIAKSDRLHALKGTNKGLQMALDALGVSIDITSWENMQPEGVPGTIDIELRINNNLDPDAAEIINDHMISDILKTVDSNKRLSVHYQFKIGIDLTQQLVIASSLQVSTVQYIGGTI